MTAEYQTPLGDFDPLDSENHLIGQPERERREVGFYPSLQSALSPFVGEESARDIAEIETRDRNIHSKDLYTPVSTTRDRLPTREAVAKEVLGNDASQTEKTIQIVRPPQQFIWIPEHSHEWRRSDNPELKQLGKLLWDGKQVLYRFEVEDEGVRKVLFVSDPQELRVRGLPICRIEKYERVGDREKPEFKVTYHPYGDGSRPFEKHVEIEETEPTGEVEVYNRGNIQITKIRRPTPDKSTEVVFCGITNKESGGTFVLNDIHPEYVILESGKKIGANIPDYPYIVLPDGKPSCARDLRAIGREIAGIDLYHEAFKDGIDPFLKYFASRQLDAAATTGVNGLVGINTLGATGVGFAMVGEDENRYQGGAMALLAYSTLTYGNVRFGSRYRDMKNAIKRRSILFVEKLASHGISFD